jgi:hypothetical protein
VQRQRAIHQDHILENFSESIHGEGLLKKGLIVAPNCASCHTAHSILPHTDPASSISRRNIATICTKCQPRFARHRKSSGACGRSSAHPAACVDCHQPHKVRNLYDQDGVTDRMAPAAAVEGGMAGMFAHRSTSPRHAKTSCSQ